MVGTDVQIYYKKYYIHICVCKKVLLIFLYRCVPTKMEVNMIKDKIKKSLQLCSEKKCNECVYNGWIREVCQKVLMTDALKVIEKER